MVKIYYAKCHERAKELYHGHADDSCWDIYAATRYFVEEHRDLKTGKHIPSHYVYGSGLRFFIPRGYEIEIRNRSSIFTTGLMLMPGTVDCGYSGEVQMRFYEVAGNGTIYEAGERVAQLKVNPALYFDVEFELIPEDNLEMMYKLAPEYASRGNNGFGSTGRK